MTVATRTSLESNLARLGEANARIAEAIRHAPPADDIAFAEAPDGGVSAVYRGRRLASAHRPIAEAARAAERMDIVNNAVFIALGFGVGHHIAALAERVGKAGVIIVFEPDLSLLRAVLERIDCPWLRESLVVFVAEAEDHAALAGQLKGAESIIAQGVAFIDHPANRARLGESAARFTSTLRAFVANAKTTLLTTLVRSADTVQNLLWNVDHYASGNGVGDLRGAFAGFPAVVVSAGPSLRRNIAGLAAPGVRDRCVIIAAQTTLKPLLEAGVRPHFVTALDYHEISRRFYEGLTVDDLEGVTLIADPKAHPAILDSFPGAIRCCASKFLDDLLGEHAPVMGELPGGATVAHLAFYLALHMGCEPVAFIGQDLGFTDGLYYAPGTAIHDVWAPELNAFNTIEMMEWQRIVRHRVHLSKREDNARRTIYTDAQMLAYLQQFERDFADAQRCGVRVIDATEGGVRKAHTTQATLEEVLEAHATRRLPELLSVAHRGKENGAYRDVQERIDAVRRDIVAIEKVSRETAGHLRQMLQSQRDSRTMDRLFEKVECCRRVVEERLDSFALLNQFNQLAVFRRHRADRRLQMSVGLDALECQRAQIERDLDNVTWTGDAAAELGRMLEDAANLLAQPGRRWRRPERKGAGAAALVDHAIEEAPLRATVEQTTSPRIAAIIAFDEDRHAFSRRIVGGKTVLQHTLERLSTSRRIDEIILIAERHADLDGMIDRGAITATLHIERINDSPFGPEFEAIDAARAFAPTCWRGAPGGLSAWDEALCPQIMQGVMQQRSIDAAIICGPQWALIDIRGEGGVDAIAARFLEHPDRHSIVFTQAPPGLGGCLVSRGLMGELAERNRLSTIGGLLVYQPHAPQADPIARDANVQNDPAVRSACVRVAIDSDAWLKLLAQQADLLASANHDAVLACASAIEAERAPHITFELCTRRRSRGRFASSSGSAQRPDIDTEAALRMVADIASSGCATLTFGGAGDPLLHPDFDRIIRSAKEAGISPIHVRTELRCDRETIDRLLASGVDVVSIDLNADRARTYEVMMGSDDFADALSNIEYLLERRRRLSDHAGTTGWALPWVVPRLQRCAETLDDIDSFFDRWQAMLGTAVIDPAPDDDTLIHTHAPAHVIERQRRSNRLIRCDGTFEGGDA